MSTHNINTQTLNEVETRAVREARRKTNEERARHVPPLPEIANNKAFVEYVIDSVLVPSWVAAEAADNNDLQTLKTRWKDATDAQRTAALAALTTP